MTGRHVALGADGQQARPATGLDSLVDPTGPEPDGVTLLWRGLRGDYSEAYYFARAHRGGWYSTSQPEVPLDDGPGAWSFGLAEGTFPIGGGPLVVARTATDDGIRKPGRHHRSVPAACCGALYVEVTSACSRAREKQWRAVAAYAAEATAWVRDMTRMFTTVVTAEPTPVACEHCHGEGCEGCRNRGVHPELIDERDILGGGADEAPVVDEPHECSRRAGQLDAVEWLHENDWPGLGVSLAAAIERGELP